MSKQQDEHKPSKNSKTFRTLSYFSHIGVTMAASVLIGVLLGKTLDGLFGTSPWMLLLFSLLGVGAAIKALFNMSMEKDNEDNENNH